MSWNKKYILHSESEEKVNQLHFSNFQILGLLAVSLIVLASFLLVGADYVSKTLYDKRLREFKANYNSVAENIDAIQSRLQELDRQIIDIEEKSASIYLENYDHTLGNLIARGLQDHVDVNFASYNMPHLLDNKININYNIKKGKIKEIINDIVQDYKKLFTSLKL